jgi:hypothetical protein
VRVHGNPGTGTEYRDITHLPSPRPAPQRTAPATTVQPARKTLNTRDVVKAWRANDESISRTCAALGVVSHNSIYEHLRKAGVIGPAVARPSTRRSNR